MTQADFELQELLYPHMKMGEEHHHLMFLSVLQIYLV